MFRNPKVLEIVRTLVRNKFSAHITTNGEHICFFYPLSYFRTATLNRTLGESEKHADLSFHWLQIDMLLEDPDYQKFVTAFDLELILSQKTVLEEKLSMEQPSGIPKKVPPPTTYALVVCDDELTRDLFEALFFGQFFDEGETWSFF